MNRKLAILAILAALSVHPGVAQQDPPPLQLDELVTEGLRNNPDVQAAKERWTAARQRGSQVGAWEDPMVSYTRWISTPETRVGPQENAFMISQRIPFPGKLGAMEMMADEDAFGAGARYDIGRRDIVFKIENTYYDLYTIDQSLRILDHYLDLLKDFSKVAAERYSTGDGIQANVLKSQVEISNILERRLGFRKMRASAAARLNALLNRPEGTPVGEAIEMDTSRVSVDDTSLVAQALDRRQELLSAKAMVRKSEAMGKFARLDYLPNFTLQFTYITIPKLATSMGADAGKDPYGISVGINLPLQFGRRAAALEEAEALTRANTLSQRNVENMVRAEIEDITFQLQTSGKTLDLYKTGLIVQAESSLESALSAYRTGKMDFLNLLDAERMLLQVRLGYVREQAAYRKLAAALDRALGGREDLR